MFQRTLHSNATGKRKPCDLRLKWSILSVSLYLSLSFTLFTSSFYSSYRPKKRRKKKSLAGLKTCSCKPLASKLIKRGCAQTLEYAAIFANSVSIFTAPLACHPCAAFAHQYKHKS